MQFIAGKFLTWDAWNLCISPPQFKLVRTFLIIFQIESKRRQFSAILQASWQVRETPGNPTKLRSAAPGVSCDFSFITPWHQIWVRARQVMTLTVSWKPTGSGGEGEEKEISDPSPPHTSKGRSFILSIKAHYSTMIKAAAPRVAQSCWEIEIWISACSLFTTLVPSPVSALSWRVLGIFIREL